ncbi:unnamed protein product [Rotaria sp. Silwood1]|nr:unnamed protein product [Rotaria sp. Silwood1]CAF3410430.1 unnamed protein product [Rotaria sp. Silwood1]CAF4580637.1 unnamed protein product [Rotaria sp. Silwood1]CAF4780487.1 unnamed protein product [Rotaria sp. Silwood1]
MSSMTGVRKARSTNVTSTPPVISTTQDESTILDDLRRNLHCPIQFINIYNQCYQITNLRSTLIEILCNILSNSVNVDIKILIFILDALITNHTSLLIELTDIQFKQDLLPFIKRILLKTEDNNNDLLLLTLRFLIILIENYSNLLNLTLTEWLSSILYFVVTHISSSSYIIYGDIVIELLTKIVKNFTPLPKEIVDVLGRSPSSIISTHFLTQLKTWVKLVDDTKLALFAIHLWEPLAALLSRLLTRGHTKGNEMLAVMQDAFIVGNYSIRAAAFSSWASFMSHIYRSDLNLHNDDIHQQQLYNRLLKLFLTPFLPDYTSKNKSASIAKCRAWLILLSAYPTHIDDVVLPFLSFAFGYHMTSKTTWWLECRHIGEQYLHDILIDTTNGEYIIKIAGEQILNYLFDTIVDELIENTIDENKSLGLICWNSYLTHLTHLLISNNTINDNQRAIINTCLLTRIEQLWIDSRISTRYLLKLFNTFEQTGFPLAIETVLRDSSIRTKTLSATQNNPLQEKSSSSDQSSSARTTLSDQYLHMMLEHSIRFNNDNDQTIEETYLHILSYLIDTLSKTSDHNFCHQTCSLLLKCSVELTVQPLKISFLFWHIWLRCSTHLINILNRTRTIDENNQQQETTIELLLRPLSFSDSQNLDYSYTLIWTQLFKALCRLILLDGKQLINLYIELFRHTPVFQQTINDNNNQRLFGFILTIIKCLLKNFIDIDLLNISKRLLSSIVLCYTQLSIIINSILQRLLLNNNIDNIQWLFICYCLLKSNKITTNEQSKSIVFTYVRDLIVDLFNLCKTCSQLEIILTNLTYLQTFLTIYEQISITTTSTSNSSPVLINKQQQTDNIILNKILSTLHTVYESSNGLSLLQLIYPLLIIAFQHSKTIIRNKARKCWNETFGRLTFIVYPNELRACLRDLKDKEHLLLPCFLADHDNSNTSGSGILPNSTDESQLSQQVDIVTPLIKPQQSSSEHFHSPYLSTTRSDNIDQIESKFVSIINNINHDNQSDSPVVINKRISSTSTCLTENQKEKLRTHHAIPLLCDDNSNTQSLSCTMDTPTIESMMTTYQLRNTNNGNKQSTTGNSISLFKQPISNTSIDLSQENNTTAESSSPPLPTSSTIITENENSSEQILTSNNEDDIPEESSISKKLRRSRRPSTSARKSLANNSKKKRTISSSNVVLTTVPSTTNDPSSSSSSNIEIIKTRPLKSILKRLSPTKPRQDHTRHVAFHDQVKVLLFASPARRDINNQQQKKKSPNKDEIKNVLSITTRRSNLINTNEQIYHNNNKTRSSKLFNFSDDTKPELSPKANKIEELRQIKPVEPIYPALIDCDKPLDSLIHVVYGGVCPTNAINYFHSIKMNTVGDIARSTAAQIEVYPIPPPKLANIQKALLLYQERLINSPSLSPIIGTNGESLTPIASTSEESIAISDGTFTKEASSLPPPSTTTTNIIDPHHPMYDVDTLIDSLDYERLYLNDNNDIDDDIAPASTNQIDFIRTRRQIALANRDEQMSPQKRRLSLTNKDEECIDNQEEEEDEQIASKKQTIVNRTLGERLQKAADIFKINGYLPFDDDYIELVRHLFNNSSLTHLERLHLKSLFLDN